MAYDSIVKTKNEMTLHLKSHSKNEALARTAVASFATQLDPLVSELNDIKTAVSEAVTNSIIHGYNQEEDHDIIIYAAYEDNKLYIEVRDAGIGITDIGEARTPLFTSKPDMDRSGLGFTVMENFMDSVEVESNLGSGTVVKMTKTIGISEWTK